MIVDNYIKIYLACSSSLLIGMGKNGAYPNIKTNLKNVTYGKIKRRTTSHRVEEL